MITKGTAINSLAPTAEFAVRDGVIEWINPTTAPVTDSEIDAEVSRLQAAYDSTTYQRLRAKEYPPMSDYLDAIVKGDTQQQADYIAACLAVKAKYPK
jgi:hypothetical protein